MELQISDRHFRIHECHQVKQDALDSRARPNLKRLGKDKKPNPFNGASEGQFTDNKKAADLIDTLLPS